MTIQIAQRIGRALGVTSATKTKELDEALRAYVRSVAPGATLPVTGSLPWANLTGVPATFPPSAHTHPNGDLTGYTAADVLSKLLTVDGAGSGLDADLLDGISSAGFSPIYTTGTWTPADASGAGLAFTIDDARYWKLGPLVLASTYMRYPVTASGANARVSGLPFNVNANLSSRMGFTTYCQAAIPVAPLPVASSDQIALVTTAGTLVTNAQMSNTVWLYMCIYQT